MKLIVADSVTYGEQAFQSLGEVLLVPETEIIPEVVQDADAVITRTKTRLNPELLAGSQVRFAGTCTAGTDHIDFAGLKRLGIHAASAPGCNANAVSEYLLAALLESGQPIAGKTVGIIGHGEVGTRVDRKMSALGCRVLRNDPPKAEAGAPGPYVELEELLAHSDIITLHVPLVEGGPWPTRKLIGEEEIGKLGKGTMLINACRGEALDGDAVVAARASGKISWLVLDVFDPEPDIPPGHLALADLASPHIAGHSVEGKVNGTRQIREQLVTFFDLRAGLWDPGPLMPQPEQIQVVLSAEGMPEERLRTCVRACYDIRRDDRLLRTEEDPMKQRFTRLRRTYRNRREFSATTILGLREEEKERYRELGFPVGPNSF